MREIKFRAWDKVLGKIIPDCTFSLATTLLNPDDFEVMQFTGLRDKKGKEIYEGDLIGCRRGIMRVEYANDIAAFEATNGMGARSLYGYLQDGGIEIIGNIYENSEKMELLK